MSVKDCTLNERTFRTYYHVFGYQEGPAPCGISLVATEALRGRIELKEVGLMAPSGD